MFQILRALCACSFSLLLPCTIFAQGDVPVQSEYETAVSSDSEHKNVQAEDKTEYMRPLQAWLDSMNEEDQQKACIILHDAFPRLRELKQQLVEKMKALQSVTYASQSDPMAFPALGHDLQLLRHDLEEEFSKVNERLVNEIGRSLPLGDGRGCRALSGAVPELDEK